MQEDDIATDAFLIELSNFLKSKNVKVPFVAPEPVVEEKIVVAKRKLQ